MVPLSRPRLVKKAALPVKEPQDVHKKTNCRRPSENFIHYPEVWRKTPTFTIDDDFTDVFFYHARVYVLADCIPALQSLALHKL